MNTTIETPNLRTADLPTLQELEAKRIEMIQDAQGEGLLQNIITICRELGEPFDCRYPWNQYRRAEFIDGDLRLRFMEDYAGFNPAAKKFNEKVYIYAWVGELQVCYIEIYNDDPQTRDDRYFIVFGQWVGQVRKLAERAHGKIGAIVDRSNENKRRELAERLLIGMEV